MTIAAEWKRGAYKPVMQLSLSLSRKGRRDLRRVSAISRVGKRRFALHFGRQFNPVSFQPVDVLTDPALFEYVARKVMVRQVMSPS
jgi:hypothetical protein